MLPLRFVDATFYFVIFVSLLYTLGLFACVCLLHCSHLRMQSWFVYQTQLTIRGHCWVTSLFDAYSSFCNVYWWLLLYV